MTIRPDRTGHPGEHLREALDERDLTQAELAKTMGRPAQVINEIIKGKKRITAHTALELEDALGITAEYWMNLEAHHQLHVARQDRRK